MIATVLCPGAAAIAAVPFRILWERTGWGQKVKTKLTLSPCLSATAASRLSSPRAGEEARKLGRGLRVYGFC